MEIAFETRQCNDQFHDNPITFADDARDGNNDGHDDEDDGKDDDDDNDDDGDDDDDDSANGFKFWLQ